MNGSEIIRDVSRDLNDQEPGYEYTRWTREQLQSYLREGLSTVSVQLRNLFLETFIIRVKPGGDWQKACDCTDIVRITGEVTESGRLLRRLRRIDDIDENVWTGSVSHCATTPSTYVMTGYSVSATDNSLFRVEPPMPEGALRYVAVECYDMPTGDDLEAEVPAEAEAIVKQWMLYRALSVDSENNSAIFQLAKTHQETYFALLKMAVEAEKADDPDDTIRAVQNSSSARLSRRA